MSASKKRYVCLEAGCDAVIEGGSDDELVQAVQEHVARAHDSFELDEFILAGATEVEDHGPSHS
jgi:predicted small metal-binding protein